MSAEATSLGEKYLGELEEAFGGVLKNPPAPRVARPPRIRYTHEAMVDLIVMNPAISQNEIAAHFGYSATWISQIVTSDAFQAKLAERKDEVVDPILKASIEEQFKGVIQRSLDLLREKLDRPAAAQTDTFVLRTFELASRAAGYGGKVEAPPVKVDLNVHLEDLGGRLVGLLQKTKASIDIPEGDFHETA